MAYRGTGSTVLINRMGVVPTISLAHGLSHFFHLLLAPLFPLLKIEFGLSYAELGLLMSVFFAVSGVGQALSGFLVDKIGPVPVLLASLVSMILATVVLATAPNYPLLILGSILAGLGNASFHPVDYSILNARVPSEKLGSAYAIHGISGNLGWAAAPIFLLSIASVSNWRIAVGCAGLLAVAILVLIWFKRELLSPDRFAERLTERLTERAGMNAPLKAAQRAIPAAVASSPFAFLTLPAVWMSFAFFFAYAVALGGVQSFGAEAASKLHTIDAGWIAFCLSSYMVASAGGTLLGGRLVRDPSRAERSIGIGFSGAACVALLIGFAPVSGILIPLLFGLMGFFSGIAGPSRDLLVKRAAPVGATGRVYGVVYSGLDAGMAVAPLIFGLLMDAKQPLAVWVGIAVFQALLIVSALGVGRFASKAAMLVRAKA
jgi:MFS transporter, FSR family, fosmidomycin resistance protein